MPPPNGERRPRCDEHQEAAETRSTKPNVAHIVRPTGCLCGCVNGVDCTANRPVPVVVNGGCHCGPLGLDGIKAAADAGTYCAPGRCVFAEMRGAA